MFYSKMTNNNKIWLEANTEQSESNPTLGNMEYIIGNRRLPKFASDYSIARSPEWQV